jgi:hypothetical protein
LSAVEALFAGFDPHIVVVAVVASVVSAEAEQDPSYSQPVAVQAVGCMSFAVD